MDVGVLIVFAILGALICARARVAGGAIVFAVIAMVLLGGTPVGSGLPGAVADFLTSVKAAAVPLTHGGAG
jgi:hypothetical protein